MDFSQFLLTESYTVSPYKICVAGFICTYLQRRQIADLSKISQSSSWSPSFLDVNVHGHLTYKLIMSMDCPFDELCHRIKNGSNNSASPEVFNLFNSTINHLRCFEIQHFYDFFDMIRSLMQGNFLFSDQEKRKMKFSDDLDIDSMPPFNQIHKMSLVGIFLRKLIIHYEHLSYCEASTLFDQLQHYLKNSTGLNSIDNFDDDKDENQSEANTVDGKEIGSIKDLASQLNPKLIDEIEDQLKLPKFSKLSAENQLVFSLNLSYLLNKAREQIKITGKINFSKRKLSEIENSRHEQSESMDIDDYATSTTPKCSKNIAADNSNASSIAMDLDITLNDDDKSTNSTLFGSIQGLKPSQKFGGSLKHDQNHSITKQIQNDRRVRIYDTSQHYLVKQIYKIQFNEKSTPTPQQVMRYIRSKYSQHNSFYYFRFITFNYLANLNLIRDQNTGQTDFSMNNGGSIPIVMASDNRNNMHNHNQIANGPTVGNNVGINAGQMSTISGGMNVGSGGNSIPTSVTIDSLDKKYKSLFRSINFFNDIEYLKYNNALRVNNFTLARKYFFDYFDLKKPSFEPDSDFGPNSHGHSNGHGHGHGHSWPLPINHMSHIATHINNNTNNVHNNLPQRNDGGNAGAGQAGHHHPDRHNHHIRATNDSSGRNGLVDLIIGRSTMILNSNSTNYCWSSLNLAMMYAHFRYYSLAYDALVDCLSLAREKHDERCLQYAMLWILQISQHLDHSKTSPQIVDGTTKRKNHQKVYADLDLMENIIGLILTNQSTMPYISAKAFLHLNRVQYLNPNPFVSEQFSLSDAMVSGYGSHFTRPPFLPQSLYLAIKCNLSDVLGETFSTYSAILNAYGQTHFAALLAKLWLRLDIIETIMEEKIFYLDENTSIAARNIAHYLWFVRGDQNGASDLLKKIQQCLSPYNQRSKQILERSINELKFEYHLNRCEWIDAHKCLNVIRCVDRTRSYLMLAELKRRQNQPLIALECLDLILAKPGGCKSPQSNSSICKLSGTSFFRPNVFRNDIDEKSCLEEEDNEEHEVSVVVKKVKKSSSKKSCTPRSIDSQENLENVAQKPIFLNNYYRANNLSFYERIQPPPPEELEPESERPLVPELDPYSSVECQLMRGIILEDLSTLFECVAKSLSYGFKQLECRTLIQIARLQSETYGQHHSAINIIEAILHRIYSQGTLQDLATALYVYSSIFYRMHCQGSLSKHHSIIINRLDIVSQPRPTIVQDWKTLKPASILIKRSILIREYLQDRNGLYESLRMAALIANEQNNLTERNFFAKRARIVRSTTTGG